MSRRAARARVTSQPSVPTRARPVSPAASASRASAAPSRAADAVARAQAAAAAAEAPEAATIRTVVPVAGMTCRSCELRIQKFVWRLPGVQKVEASAPRGRVVIESTKPVPPWAIDRAIRLAGYEVGHTPWLERNGDVWATFIVGVAFVAAIAILASAAGLTDLAAGVGDLAGGGLLVVLLLGLAAGVSTCAALVGGLVLALSASFESQRAAAADAADPSSSSAAKAGAATRMRPALVFLAGRVGGYAVLGAALGALGASFQMPAYLTAALMLVVAVVMTILGTRLTGISPRIATWSPTLPAAFAKRLGAGDGAAAYSDGRAAALGVASFFLPCGFTQAVQVFALTTGSPLYSGALLATFALGTAPGLLALAGLPVFVPSGAKTTVLRFVGVVVLAFAFLNGSAGLRLAGIDLNVFGAQAVAAAGSTIGADGVQDLKTTQHAYGYEPNDVVIYAGMETRWTIASETEASCAASIVVPSLGIQKRLRVGDNHITLPAMEPGTLRYSCSMGMFTGQIRIVERPAGSPAPATGSR